MQLIPPAPEKKPWKSQQAQMPYKAAKSSFDTEVENISLDCMSPIICELQPKSLNKSINFKHSISPLTSNAIPCLNQHMKMHDHGLSMENCARYLQRILPDSFRCYYCGKKQTLYHLDRLGSKCLQTPRTLDSPCRTQIQAPLSKPFHQAFAGVTHQAQLSLHYTNFSFIREKL